MTTILYSEEQRTAEAAACALLASPEMIAAKAEVCSLWLADPLCRTAAERAQVAGALDELAANSALECIYDPANPAFIWTLTLPHDGAGVAMPGSRFGVDNPDNVYRIAGVNAESTYRIRGRFPGAVPPDFSFQALAHPWADGVMGTTVGYLGLSQIAIDDDGRFEVFATPDGKDGTIACRNAISICARDSLGDWATASPAELTIERLDGPALTPLTQEARVTEAARLLRVRGALLPDILQRNIYQRAAVNTFVPPALAGPLGGLTGQVTGLGHFDLAEDEALVMSVDLQGCPYVAFQIGDPWTRSYEFRTHFGSLNSRQAELDEDGRMTLVLARSDPGFVNWIEPADGHSGSLTFRWQGVPDDAPFGPDTLRCELIKISEVPQRVKGRFLSPAEREEQRHERTASYDVRTRN